MKASAFRGLKLPDVQSMSVSDFRAYALGKPLGAASKPTMVDLVKSPEHAAKKKSGASTAVPSKKPRAKSKAGNVVDKLPAAKTDAEKAKAQAPGLPAEKATSSSSSRMSAAEFRDMQTSGEVIRIGPPNKMGARKVYTTEGTFDSMEEHKRWCSLKLLLRAGVISDLRRQVKYSLDAGGIHISNYVADFVYLNDGVEVVEDSKGFKTPEYIQKRRLMKEILGIEIFETGKSTSRPPRSRKAARG